MARNAGSREDLDKTEADRKKLGVPGRGRPGRPGAGRRPTTTWGSLSAKAQVEAARAAVRDAELNLGYCRMYAPIDGRIGEAKVKVGNLVGPDAGGGAETTPSWPPSSSSTRWASTSGSALATWTAGDEADRRGARRPPDASRARGRTRAPLRGAVLLHRQHGRRDHVDLPGQGPRSPTPGGTLLPGEYVKVRMVVDRLEDAVVVPETGGHRDRERPGRLRRRRRRESGDPARRRGASRTMACGSSRAASTRASR